MTYRELLYKATSLCSRDEITIDEYMEMTKPLNREVEQAPCEDCCNGNQIEKAKLCQKSYLAGMEHKQEPCEDAISRKFFMRDLLLKAQGEKDVSIKWLEEYINSLPPVTPTHGTCKECVHFWCVEGCGSMKVCSKHGAMRISQNFYCKDFEKTGEE